MKHNNITHPPHYCTHNSGIECITVAENLNFALGSAFKYLFRCNHKGKCLEDLQKAEWYLQRELANRTNRGFWFQSWHSFESDYSSRKQGCIYIREILEYENRYSGHMAAALDCIYEAGVVHKGPAAVRRALWSVGKMVRIEEDKLV